MRIKSFNCLGHKVKIKYVKRLPGGFLGDCEPDRHLIKVVTHKNGKPLPDSTVQHSRHHEQAHYFMKLLGRDDLYEDEAFIDSLGAMMHQYEESKE
jgi:hypothetical protein